MADISLSNLAVQMLVGIFENMCVFVLIVVHGICLPVWEKYQQYLRTYWSQRLHKLSSMVATNNGVLYGLSAQTDLGW